jgi:hypothetical protein
MLVYIMQNLNWRDAYTFQFLKMKRLISAFEFRLEETMPKLHDHLMGSEAVDVGDFSGLFQLIFPHF